MQYEFPFFARKNRGTYKNELIYPHLHPDGTYVATNSKYKIDYIKVDSLDELSTLVRAGYGARMSNPRIPQAQSFICHENIIFLTEYNLKDSIKKMLTSFSEKDILDKKIVANRRKEQVFLRSYLLQGKKSACMLCNRVLPAELLVAAHIKPRFECNAAEKVDFDNIAALMCLLGCDSLFENGFIYVADGIICKNTRRPKTPHLDEAINLLINKSVANWNSSSTYYNWHANEFLRK